MPSTSITGVINDGASPQTPQDPYIMPDPTVRDSYQLAAYNDVPVATTEGVIEASVVSGENIRLYPGNETQLPDPLFESLNGGPGTTSAYRGQAIGVFENVNVSTGLPTFWALLSHQTIKTVGQFCKDRCLRSNLIEDDLDFRDLDMIPLRGFLIDGQQSPKTEMDQLSRVFDCQFVEGFRGKITGSPVSETIAATLTIEDTKWATGKNSTGVPTAKERDSSDLPRELDFSYISPTDNKFETNTKTSTRQVTDSQGTQSFDVKVTLLDGEAQKIVDRELQEIWRDRGSWSFTTYHKFAWLEPGQKIKIPFDESVRTVRINQITGPVPGVLTMAVSPQEGVIVRSPFASFFPPDPTTAIVPANTVATFIDVPPINTQQDTPGIMIAVCSRDLQSGQWVSANLYVYKGSGWKFLKRFDTPAIMGRVVMNALPSIPDGYISGTWEDDSTITFDLFNGVVETLAEDQALEGDGLFIIGDELVAIATMTRINGFPNRWTGTHMQRMLRGTFADSHEVNERIVKLNSSVKFIRLDEEERGIERTYHVVTMGVTVNQRIEEAADILFTWLDSTVPVPEDITISFDGIKATVKWTGISGFAYDLATDESGDPSTFLYTGPGGEATFLVPVEITDVFLRAKRFGAVSPFEVVPIPGLGKIRGRDTDVVNLTSVTTFGLTQQITDRVNNQISFKVFANFDTVLTPNDPSANCDSVEWVRAKVYNKFGEEITQLDTAFSGRGECGHFAVSRKNADLDRELVVSLSFFNAFGWTASSLWILPGNVASFTPPNWRARVDCPDNLIATEITSASVQLHETWSGTARTVWRREISGSGYGTAGSWVDVTSSTTGDRITIATVSGNSPSANYEFVLNDGTLDAGGNSSNVDYVSIGGGGGDPTRPSPSGVTGSSSDSTHATFSWVRNATDNTDVEYSTDNGGSWTALGDATQITLTLTGTAGSVISLVVRNKWSTGTTYSANSNSFSVTLPGSNPSSLDATNLRITGMGLTSFLHNVAFVNFAWDNNLGSDPTLYFNGIANHPTTTANTQHIITGGGEVFEAFVRTAGSSNDSNHVEDTTPQGGFDE
jgi:hypothetical protein